MRRLFGAFLTCFLFFVVGGVGWSVDPMDDGVYESIFAWDAVHEAVQREQLEETSLWSQIPPPDPLDETARSGRNPSGSAVWVEGYWRWYPGLQRYLWVSGCWREPPPNLVWYEGHWRKGGDRWLWEPGYWGPRRRHRLHEVNRRPPSRRLESPGLASGPGTVWIPGAWRFDGRRFVWVPGEWRRPPRQHMVWISGSWIKHNNRYVYLPGRWDYARTARVHRYVPGRQSSVFVAGRQKVPTIHSSPSPGHRVKNPPLQAPTVRVDETQTRPTGSIPGSGRREEVRERHRSTVIQSRDPSPSPRFNGKGDAKRDQTVQHQQRVGPRSRSHLSPGSALKRPRINRGRVVLPELEEDPANQPISGAVSR